MLFSVGGSSKFHFATQRFGHTFIRKHFVNITCSRKNLGGGKLARLLPSFLLPGAVPCPKRKLPLTPTSRLESLLGCALAARDVLGCNAAAIYRNCLASVIECRVDELIVMLLRCTHKTPGRPTPWAINDNYELARLSLQLSHLFPVSFIP